MKIMRKLAILLTAAVILGSVGCGNTMEQQSEQSDKTTYTSDAVVVTDSISGSVCNAGKLY